MDIAFQRLKEAMIQVPVLALPNFKKPFVVETDASEVGMGAIMENKRPLEFFSQALAPPHKFKAVYEHELTAIVFAIRKWRPYLLGRRFIVGTDQKSLKFLLKQRVIAREQQRWITK